MKLSNTPLNQYSLQSLELWLKDLGACKDVQDPSKWYLKKSNWDAIINFEQDDFSVIWNCNGNVTKRLFSYCIFMEDVESAILQGP